MGRDVFREFSPGITLLGTEWFVSRPPQLFVSYLINLQGNEPRRPWRHIGVCIP